MPSIRLLAGIASIAVTLLATQALPAAEPYQEFVHGLLQKGYSDVALDYLDSLEGHPNLPPQFRETLDLERCNCYLVWARATTDAKLVEQRQGQAQAYLDKFLKEHPKDPRAATAISFWGDVALQRGQQLLAQARRADDKAQRNELIGQARTAMAEAGRQLGEAAALFSSWVKQLPAASADDTPQKSKSSAATRQEVELGAAEVNFKLALVYFHIAQTYEDIDEEKRADLLKKAAFRFDQIYQDLRNTTSQACLFAHLWHARTLDELGDSTTAQEIYEEVLAGAPESDRGARELAPLYAETGFFQLRPLAKKKPEEFLEQAGKWLQSHKAWRRMPGYQGLALEMAKIQMGLAQKASGERRTKLMEQAVAILGSVAKTPSEYQEEAAFLRRRAQEKSSGSAGNAGVEECFTLGDAALNAKQWAEAQENYAKALKLATDAKDQKLVASARQRLARARYNQAAALREAGKLEEALKAAFDLAHGDPADPTVSRAALLALSSASGIYRKADDKDAAAAQVEKVAEFMVKNWARRPEADDARITQAQLRLRKGDIEGAHARIREVTADSPRYPLALYIQGRDIHWKAYLDEKGKEEAARDVQRMNASRDQAQKCLQEAVDRLSKGIRAGAGDADTQLIESQLLLAEMFMEGKQYGQAVTLLDPLVARIKSLKPRSIDPLTLGTVVVAVRANLAAGKTDRAAEIALVLAEIAGDEPQLNRELVNFTRLLGQEYSRADAAAQSVETGSTARKEALAKRQAVQELAGKVLERLVPRKEYSLVDLAILGDVCELLSMYDQAQRQYQRILDKAGKESEGSKASQRAIIRARSQMVVLLRMQGKFEQAVTESDKLIGKNPRALEPRLVKARILEEWAKKDPAKYDAAVAQWAEVRVLLGRLQQKPDEYYDALYNTASCLFAQWQATKDESKLSLAEKTLKAALFQNSKLNGPDTVRKYQDLLKKIEAARPKSEKAAKTP